MKQLIVSLTIGACLLLSSAGVVFATDIHGGPVGPHPGGIGQTGAPNGQPGTGGAGASCGAAAATPPPGQAVNNSESSPFNAASKKYAGAGGPGANGSVHANSQYDVSCFQMH